MNWDICREPVGGTCSALNVLHECGDCRVSGAEVIFVPLGSEKQKRGEYQGLHLTSPALAAACLAGSEFC